MIYSLMISAIASSRESSLQLCIGLLWVSDRKMQPDIVIFKKYKFCDDSSQLQFMMWLKMNRGWILDFRPEELPQHWLLHVSYFNPFSPLHLAGFVQDKSGGHLSCSLMSYPSTRVALSKLGPKSIAEGSGGPFKSWETGLTERIWGSKSPSCEELL